MGRILASLRCQTGLGLLYTERHEDEPQAHVREFTVEQVAYLDLEALDYMYAAVFYEDIWEDVPLESPAETPPDSPNAPNDIGIESYDGPNWQDLPDEGTASIAVTEQRLFQQKLPHLSARLHKWAIY